MAVWLKTSSAGISWPGSRLAPQRKPGDSAISAVALGEQRAGSSRSSNVRLKVPRR
jgi:hypothetical protein